MEKSVSVLFPLQVGTSCTGNLKKDIIITTY